MATVRIIPASVDKKEKLRVAAYCRVSSDSADQLHSYAAQLRAYTEYIKNHDDWELVDVYADSGLTGTRMDKREEFQRMIEDCRKGKIDRILVKSISRFARNTKDCLDVLRLLKSLDVSVVFEEDHIDTETLTSEMMVSVLGSLAQQESISISQNMRMSYRRRMEKGEFLTARAPLGYRLSNGSMLQIEPSEVETIRTIFQMYVDGMSSLEIARWLTEREIPSPSGNPKWLDGSVRYILSNEKYVGDTLCQKVFTSETLPFSVHRNHGEKEQFYIENSHDAVITRETYEQARRLSGTRSYMIRNHYADSPFRGRIICGACGHTMIRRKNDHGFIYFSCKKHHQKAALCPGGRISESAVNMVFVKMYNRLRRNLELVFRPVLNQLYCLEESLHQNCPELMSLNREIADTAEQSYKVRKLFSMGRISADLCKSKELKIDQRLHSLKKQRSQMLQNRDVDQAIKAITELYQTLADGPDKLTAFDETLFTILIEQIVVESKAVVRFKLHGGLELSERIEEAQR